MQKIIPHLWFDTQAKEAAEFYTSIFPDSKIISTVIMKDTPSGDAAAMHFHLSGYEFMATSAGPYFKPNPSLSFMVNFDPSRDANAKENLDAMWSKLAEGGSVLMELQEYPFSKHYGWLQDKYGFSWQLILTDPEGEERPFIVPSIMFVGDVVGKAEEATDFYISVFKDSKRGIIARHGAGQEPEKEGTVMFTDFTLFGQWFAANDSAHEHKFAFTEALSLMVQCDTQAEIDEYWKKLSAVPEAEQCGWLKDKYGFSWQITPTKMNEMIEKGTEAQVAAVTKAFLPMKKLNISEIEAAYENAS